jgi:hypothetical protein
MLINLEAMLRYGNHLRNNMGDLRSPHFMVTMINHVVTITYYMGPCGSVVEPMWDRIVQSNKNTGVQPM